METLRKGNPSWEATSLGEADGRFLGVRGKDHFFFAEKGPLRPGGKQSAPTPVMGEASLAWTPSFVH